MGALEYQLTMRACTMKAPSSADIRLANACAFGGGGAVIARVGRPVPCAWPAPPWRSLAMCPPVACAPLPTPS